MPTYPDGLGRAAQILDEAAAHVFTDSRTDELLAVLAKQMRDEAAVGNPNAVPGGPRPNAVVEWTLTDAAAATNERVMIFAPYAKQQALSILHEGVKRRMDPAFRAMTKTINHLALQDAAKSVGLTVDDLVRWEA